MRLLLFNLATDADDPILGFTTRWIQALAKRVEFIHVISMRAGRVEVPENVRVYSVGKEKGYSEPRRAVEFYRHLLRILREDRINVCFSHMIPIFTILAAPVLKIRRIPIVTWYAHPSLTWKLKLAHHLSDQMVTSLKTAYPYRKDKLIVIGQGIDTDLFAPDRTLPQEPPMILCVGRLSPVKEHPTLLKAIALLRERFKQPFQVIILGGAGSEKDKEYVQSLQAMVKELKLDGWIKFMPPVPQKDLLSWYRRCTVHVNLTPTGFGDKVAWEAMACGKPCIACNDGFRETMGKYASRLLFVHGCADDLASKLEAFLCMSHAEREAIGTYLKEQVVQMHSLQHLTGKLMNLMHELTRRRLS